MTAIIAICAKVAKMALYSHGPESVIGGPKGPADYLKFGELRVDGALGEGRDGRGSGGSG